MNDPSDVDPRELDWAQCKRVDELCDRFEEAWLADERPDLHSFVRDASGAFFIVLLRELLGVDIWYRRKRGERPTPLEYEQLFPEHSPLISRVFSVSEVSDHQTFDTDSSRPSTVGDSLHGFEQTVAPEVEREFEVLEVLGRGSMRIVYKARHRTLRRLVTIKLQRPSRFARVEELDRFEREARCVAQLNHQGIVRVYDIGRRSMWAYLVSEFVEGETLATALTGRSFSVRESAELVAAVAAALDHAHRRGVVHGDLKTSNIILENGSPARPKLTDFGLALKSGDEETTTQAGDAPGAPAYLSPEQARGDAHQVDARSDIYSMGVILYELLSGERPFRGTPRQLPRQILDAPRPPRQLNDAIPPDLETIALKCLAKEPAHRYQTAAELSDELQRFLSGRPIHARPASAQRRC